MVGLFLRRRPDAGIKPRRDGRGAWISGMAAGWRAALAPVLGCRWDGALFWARSRGARMNEFLPPPVLEERA